MMGKENFKNDVFFSNKINFDFLSVSLAEAASVSLLVNNSIPGEPFYPFPHCFCSLKTEFCSPQNIGRWSFELSSHFLHWSFWATFPSSRSWLNGSFLIISLVYEISATRSSSADCYSPNLFYPFRRFPSACLMHFWTCEGSSCSALGNHPVVFFCLLSFLSEWCICCIHPTG